MNCTPRYCCFRNVEIVKAPDNSSYAFKSFYDFCSSYFEPYPISFCSEIIGTFQNYSDIHKRPHSGRRTPCPSERAGVTNIKNSGPSENPQTFIKAPQYSNQHGSDVKATGIHNRLETSQKVHTQSERRKGFGENPVIPESLCRITKETCLS
jgi:hypothetical protein